MAKLAINRMGTMTKIKAAMIVICATAALAGCIPSTPTSQTTALNDITVKADKFSGERLLTTPFYLSRQGFTDTFPVRIAIQADVTNGPPTTAQLFVKKSGTEWGFYNSAIGEDRYKFTFMSLDNNVTTAAGLATTEEFFVLEIPIRKLEEMSSSDYEIKVYGRRDSGVFVVPSSVTIAFLVRLNEVT